MKEEFSRKDAKTQSGKAAKQTDLTSRRVGIGSV
jgi:hypothetical protein